MSILEGDEAGRIQGLLIDPEEGRVAAFVLTTIGGGEGLSAIPYSSVNSFGSFALTVSSGAEIRKLADDSRLMSLFEQDTAFIGFKVHEADGKHVGFVNDVGFDSQDGRALFLKVSSDAGFLSPFRAAVSFDAVDRVESQQVFLKEGETVTFRKEIPGSPPGSAFVPLIIEENELRQSIEQRLTGEMSRVQRNVMEKLETEYEQFFLSHHKEAMSRELLDLLRRSFEERMEEAFTAFHVSLLDELKALLDKMTSLDTYEREKAKLEEEIASLREGVQARIGEVEKSISATLEQRLIALEAMFSSRIEKHRDETHQGLGIFEAASAEVTARLEKEFAAFTEKMEKSAARMDELAGRIDGVENALNAPDEETNASNAEPLEKAIGELGGRIAAARAEFDERIALLKDESAATRAEAEAALRDFVTGQVENAVKRAADFSESLGARIDRANALLAELSREPARLAAEFDAKLDEAAETLKKEAEAAAARSEEKADKHRGRNLELEERINDEIMGLQDALRRGLEQINKFGRALQEVVEMGGAEFDREKMAVSGGAELRIGDLADGLNSLLVKINAVEERLAAVPAAVADESAGRRADDEKAEEIERRLTERLARAEEAASAVSELNERLKKMEVDIRSAGTGALEEVRREFDERLREAGERSGVSNQSVADAVSKRFSIEDLADVVRRAWASHIRDAASAGAGSVSNKAVSSEEALGVLGGGIVETLLGKRVARDIFAGGDLIIPRGRVVDHNVIELAKVHGKFLELSLGVHEE